MRRKCGSKCGSLSDFGLSQNFLVRAWILYFLKNKGPAHGYEISSSFTDAFPELEEAFGISEMGNFYRILRMLEMEGLITSKWELVETGPAKRVYTITELGEKELERLKETLKQSKTFIERILNLMGGG